MEAKEYVFLSECLGGEAKVMIFVPKNRENDGRNSIPVLWTVGPGDHRKWMMQSDVCRLAEEAGMAVVSVDTTDTWGGLNRPAENYYFEDYLTRELPALVESVFPACREPEFNYITGFSKGSYIAFRMGMSHPERFGTVISIGGGGLDAYSFYYDIGTMNPGLIERMFGLKTPEEFEKSDYNPENLVERLCQEEKKLPALYLFCGEKDALARVVNVRMHMKLEALNVPHQFTLFDSGHDWVTVNRSIEKAIAEMGRSLWSRQ